MTRTLWDTIPDNAINKEFYREKVCTCKNYSYINHLVPCKETYSERLSLRQEGKPVLQYMKCGLLLPLLSECRGCKSIFYPTCFTHPQQRQPHFGHLYKRGTYCWHCLEDNPELEEHRSWESIGIVKSPPPDYLLNPRIKPVSYANKLSSIFDSLDLSLSVPVGNDVDDWWK